MITPGVLTTAVKSNDLNEVTRLLHSSPLISHDKVLGSVQLYHALSRGNTDMMALLQLHKADATLEQGDGSTQLTLAAEKGCNPALVTLLEHGIDVNSVDFDGNTALHHAAKESRISSMELLIEKKADVNAKNIAQTRVLMLAAMNNRKPDAIRCLIQNRADLHARDVVGWDALKWSAAQGSPMVPELLSLGADPLSKCNLGDNALHLVIKKSKKHTLGVLIESIKLCDNNFLAMNNTGQTILHVLASASDTDLLLYTLDLMLGDHVGSPTE